MFAMDTSYLTTQVTTIIGQLHGLFDDIGVPSHERESREAEASNYHSRQLTLLMPHQLFSALSETLHNHLRVVTT